MISRILPVFSRCLAFVLLLGLPALAAEPVPGVAVKHDDVRINYLGVWKAEAGSASVHQAEANGAFYEFTFLGTGIEATHQVSPQGGSVDFFLDGKPVKTSDCAAEGTAELKPVYSVQNLPYRLHTLKAVKRSGSTMAVGGFTVSGVQRFKETPGNTFEDRAKKLKASADYSTAKIDLKLGLLKVPAYFNAGKDSEALSVARDFVSRMSTLKNVNTAFATWPITDVYIRHNAKLPPDIKNPLAQWMKTNQSYHWVSTGNLFAMTAIPYYLATEQFGANAMAQPFAVDAYHKTSQKDCNQLVCRYYHAKGVDWSKYHDGKGRPIFLPLGGIDQVYDYVPGHDPTARLYIEKIMIEDVVREGMMEYNCWPYGADNMGPYLTLIDNAKDRVLAKKAAIAYETILASSAANWLGGHLAAAQGRSYPNVFSQRPGNGLEIFWPYFGGAPEAQPGPSHFNLFAIASHYRMPEYIAGAAQNRTGEYVSKTNFMKRKQYSYLNQRYGVYSQFDKGVPTEFNPRFGIVPQSKRSGVVWEGVNGPSVLWIEHPVSANGKGTSGYATTDRVRFTQYKGTLVQTYDIPKTGNLFDGKAEYPYNPFTMACVPTSYLATASDPMKNRVFLAYKNVMIAITASVPIQWNLPAQGQGGEPLFLEIKGNQFGVALETALPEEYPGTDPRQKLEAFRRHINAKPNATYDLKTLTMSYMDRNGVVIRAGYDGFPSSINGGIVDQEQWPEIANPWMAQPWGGNLTFFDGPDKYLYDFTHWEVKRAN